MHRRQNEAPRSLHAEAFMYMLPYECDQQVNRCVPNVHVEMHICMRGLYIEVRTYDEHECTGAPVSLKMLSLLKP